MQNSPQAPNTYKSLITGLILAGGQGRRAGGRDKGLLPWHGKPLVAHTVERVSPQVKKLLISCNRNQQDYGNLATRTVSDLREGYQGPLAGLESAIKYIDTDYVLLVACDLPEVPEDLGGRLIQGLKENNAQDCNVCVAWDGQREQYLCALIRRKALYSLAGFLDSGGRAVKHWYSEQGYTLADFSEAENSF
ncbi:MAG: molybdenum cofactor guanylyltransferase MobA, partial [Halieaceae bacterium]